MKQKQLRTVSGNEQNAHNVKAVRFADEESQVSGAPRFSEDAKG